MSRKSDKIWAFLGKLGVGVTIVSGAVAIHGKFFSPTGVNIDASITQSEFSYPPEIQLKFETFEDPTTASELADLLQAEMEALFVVNDEKPNPPTDWAQVYLISEKLTNQLKRNWPNEVSYGSPWHFRSFYNFSLVNHGDAQASNTQINFPKTGPRYSQTEFKGVYQLQIGNQSPRVSDFQGFINIGDIRQGDNVLLQIWSVQSLSNEESENISVSHESGISKVEAGRTVFGFWGAINAFVPRSLLSGFKLGFGMFVIFSLITLFSNFIVNTFHSPKKEKSDASNSTEDNP